MIAENITFNFVPITEENFAHLCQLPSARQWIEGNFVSLPSKFNLGYHCVQSEDKNIIIYPLLRNRDWIDTYFAMVYYDHFCVFMFGGEKGYFPYYKVVYWDPGVVDRNIKNTMIKMAESIIRQSGEFLNGDINPNHSFYSVDDIKFIE